MKQHIRVCNRQRDAEQTGRRREGLWGAMGVRSSRRKDRGEMKERTMGSWEGPEDGMD